ncbi:hypothetical protein [Halorussus halophilus]|uniref:hypothetical protein n=1 Tax=Halorussus halophilus TaxID=2650975 RepID=UPI001300DE20|nr:hypothetical protein [Halorussus halophilus]
MERTLDLSNVEVRDIELRKADFPNAIELRVEAVVTELSDEAVEAFVGKQFEPKALILEEAEDEGGEAS